MIWCWLVFVTLFLLVFYLHFNVFIYLGLLFLSSCFIFYSSIFVYLSAQYNWFDIRIFCGKYLISFLHRTNINYYIIKINSSSKRMSLKYNNIFITPWCALESILFIIIWAILLQRFVVFLFEFMFSFSLCLHYRFVTNNNLHIY